MSAIMTEALSEALALVARIKPASISAAATIESDVVDMMHFQRVLFIFNFGDYGAGNDGVVNGGIYFDTASGGAFANQVTGKAITASLFSNSTQDDQVAILEVDQGELIAMGQNARYVRAKATPTNQAMTMSIIGLGAADFRPSNQFDLAKVKQITN